MLDIKAFGSINDHWMERKHFTNYILHPADLAKTPHVGAKCTIFCSMNIAEDVRRYAAEQGLAEEEGDGREIDEVRGNRRKGLREGVNNSTSSLP